MLTIILDVYCGPGRPRTFQVNLPDDSPDTLIQSAVRDAVNRVHRGAGWNDHGPDWKGGGMSKELWIAAHERAVDEAMEANPGLSWDDAYTADATAKRADVLCRERYAAMIDEAKERAKYEQERADKRAGSSLEQGSVRD